MTKQQKIILVILGILDLAIISGLAYVIITWHPTATTPVSSLTTCQLAIAEGLQPDFAVAFNESTESVAPLESEIILNAKHTAYTTTLEDGQILWIFLEHLSPIVTNQCENTTQISVRFTASEGHFFIIKTADLISWNNHQIDDELFSQRILYQVIHLSSSDFTE